VTLLFISAAFAYARLREKPSAGPVWLLLIPVFLMNAGYIRFKPVLPEHRAARELCQEVPGNASVAAANELIPHMKRQKAIYCTWAALPGVDRFDYLLIREADLPLRTEAEKDGLFEEAKSAGGYVLYVRKGQ
jgi:hypothetical protein